MPIQRRRLATHSGCLALCLGQDNIQEICRSGHWCDRLQTARRHCRRSVDENEKKKKKVFDWIPTVYKTRRLQKYRLHTCVTPLFPRVDIDCSD
jgi:hypothetical protein